jgi:hypothetical protein
VGYGTKFGANLSHIPLIQMAKKQLDPSDHSSFYSQLSKLAENAILVTRED